MKNSIIVIAAAALITIGCNEASTTSSSDNPMSKPSASTPANPVLTYEGTMDYKGKSYRTVAVMNADGSNQTNLYGKDQPVGEYFMSECWAPAGSTVGFVQTNFSTTAPVSAIKAIDVSVNSSGAVVGSNVRTIYSAPTNVGISAGLAWSSTAAMGKIAYVTYNSSNTVRTVWVIPQAGGTPIKVWETDATYVKEDGSVIGHKQGFGYPAWSPDDHRLAVIRQDSSNTPTWFAVSTIMIFNTTDNGATWTYADSIKVPGTTDPTVLDLEWSSSANGINKIAYHNAENAKIYYVDPVTGAVPYTNGVQGCNPAWAPDNSALIFYNLGQYRGNLSRITPFTTTVTNIVPHPAYDQYTMIRWKR